MGRPSSFTKEIADEICERLGNGEPLAQICRDEHMPALRTVYDWQDREEFSARIARAREAGFDQIAVDAMSIADETEHDTVRDDKGNDRPNSEWITRSRLRVETRLKLLAKWDPRRYGDKIDVTSGDEPVRQLDETAVATRIASLIKTGLDRDGAG